MTEQNVPGLRMFKEKIDKYANEFREWFEYCMA